MGRPPCCDKTGVKKGPWTPEEDIILVSYIQEHGPGNWRSVPLNTGLLRCSKSCRLRWTNYLRPGIKRGNFNEQEERMIVHLQALLGNRWAAIASYLPQRTDNDIKNYWNTHLKKKLTKQQLTTTTILPSSPPEGDHSHSDTSGGSGLVVSEDHTNIARGQWERRLQTDIHLAKKALRDALSLDVITTTDDNNGGHFPLPPLSTTTTTTVTATSSCSSPPTTSEPPTTKPSYAYSADNIAKLLQGWMKKGSDIKQTKTAVAVKEEVVDTATGINTQMIEEGKQQKNELDLSQNSTAAAAAEDQPVMNNIAPEQHHQLMYYGGFDGTTTTTTFGPFDSFDSSHHNNNSDFSPSLSPFQGESKPSAWELDHQFGSVDMDMDEDDDNLIGGKGSLSLLEKWLFDDQSSTMMMGSSTGERGGEYREELTNYGSLY